NGFRAAKEENPDGSGQPIRHLTVDTATVRIIRPTVASLCAKRQKLAGDGAALPPAAAATVAEPNRQQPRVVLGSCGQPCTVMGNQKRALRILAYKLIKALLAAGEMGLSKSELEAISSYARQTLKNPAADDSDWAQVLHFAGRTGMRYRIA